MELHPELNLIIAQVLTFLAGLFLLWKIAYKPVSAIIKERADKIARDLESAEHARREMEKVKADFDDQMAHLQQQTQSMIQEATREGQAARESILSEARAQSEEIVKRAEERIEIEKRKAIKELRQEVAQLALTVAEKVIGASVNRETQQRLVNQTLAELEERK